MIVDCKSKGTPLPHTWSRCIGAGRAKEGLRSQWQEQLRCAVRECGFEYIRFHGLLAEDMFPVSERGGELFFNWTLIDQLFDELHAIGIRPVVELGFMPPALASGSTTQFWWRGNVTPPCDYDLWGRLVGELTAHFVERYSLSEVRKWYFEVWNEPNLHAFWDGTRSQYFELYRVSALAVKSVDPALRVGGPATSNFVPDGRFDGETEDLTKHVTHQAKDIDALDWHGVWIEQFLDFCRRENLPVDFVSAHPYPTDFALDGLQGLRGRSRYADSLRDDIGWLREAVVKSAYPDAELLLTEWSSSPTSRDYCHDFLPAADYIVKCNLENAGRVGCLSYWVFTDIFEEVGAGPEAFHGGFGLMTAHGIHKPTYHAYRFLNRLGNETLGREGETIVTRTAEGKIAALLWNYAKELRQAVPMSEYPDWREAERIEKLGDSRNQRLTLTGLAPGAVFEIETLDVEHSTAFLWRRMGCPRNLTRAQESALMALEPSKAVASVDSNGVLDLTLTLSPWAVVSVNEI